jgi:hypothetical protein
VRLEATWQARWQEQAASTADLRGRLESLQPSSPAQAREVQRQLPEVAAALDLPAAAAVFANPVWDPTPPAAATGAHTGDVPSVTAILRRLSLLEERVGQQLDHIEGMCDTGRSCDRPTALEGSDAFGTCPPTVAYGSGSPAARQGCHGKGSQSWESPLDTASPRTKPSQLLRPSGTAAGRNDALQASREVDQQVAATHAVISQIQGQSEQSRGAWPSSQLWCAFNETLGDTLLTCLSLCACSCCNQGQLGARDCRPHRSACRGRCCGVAA